MLALDRHRADLCKGCGGLLTETTASDRERGYAVDTPHRCFRCTAIQREQEEWAKEPFPRALVWTVRERS